MWDFPTWPVAASLRELRLIPAHPLPGHQPLTDPSARPQPLRPPAAAPRAPDRRDTEQPHRSQPRPARVGLAAPVASLTYLAPLISAYHHRNIVVESILILINANHSNVSKCKMMSFGSRCKCSVICHMELIPHL